MRLAISLVLGLLSPAAGIAGPAIAAAPASTKVVLGRLTADKAPLKPAAGTQKVTYTTTVTVPSDVPAENMALELAIDGKSYRKASFLQVTAEGARECGRGPSPGTLLCFWPGATPRGPALKITSTVGVTGAAAGDRFEFIAEADADNLLPADPADVLRTITTTVTTAKKG